MKKIRQKLVIGSLSVALCMCCVPTSFAKTAAASSSTQESLEKQKKQTQSAIDSANQAKEKAKSEVSSLQGQADSIDSKLDSYTKKLDDTNSQIQSAEKSVAATNANISKLQEELAEAKTNEQTQYDDMKKRIAYMYEHNAGESLLTAFFNSTSVGDFISQADYIASIEDYDRNMLKSYQTLQKTITDKTAELKKKQQDLAVYQDDLASSQQQLGTLISSASDELTSTNGKVDSAQDNLEQINTKIQTLESQRATIEAQESAAQAEMAKQLQQQMQQDSNSKNGQSTTDNGTGGNTDSTVIKPTEDTGGAIAYSDEDLLLMAAAIEAEAGNQSYEGKAAVGSVIMNRVKSKYFPNSLAGVISQKNQFQSWRNGMISAWMAKGPSQSSYSAAKQVMNGYRSGDWLFFMTKAAADSYGIVNYTQIGAHVFFYAWVTNKSTG